MHTSLRLTKAEREAILAARLARNVTYIDIAREIGTNRATLNYLLQGARASDRTVHLVRTWLAAQTQPTVPLEANS